MIFENWYLKISSKYNLKFSFLPSRAAASLLGPRSKPARPAAAPASHSAACFASAQPSPARVWPADRAAPRRSPAPHPDRGRARPPRGGHAPATPAVRRSWPASAPTHLPSSAEVAALLSTHSRPLSPCSLLLSPRQSTAPPQPRRPNPPSVLHHGQQLCLALRHLVLAVVTSFEPR